MNRDDEQRFRIIHGGGEGSDHARSAPLVEVGPAPAERQLMLPGIRSNHALLISVGFEYITFTDFAGMLRTHGVRSVVDIRMLAAFRSRGFQRWQTAELLSELGISYLRISALGNKFLGSSTNPLMVRQRYADHVKEQPQLLRDLGARLEQGPVLLLGRGSEHSGSEREIIAHTLAELGFSFDLAIVMQPPSPMRVMQITPPRKASKSKKRGRSGDKK